MTALAVIAEATVQILAWFAPGFLAGVAWVIVGDRVRGRR